MSFFDNILKKYAPTYMSVFDATRARDENGDVYQPFQTYKRPRGDFVGDTSAQPQYGLSDPEPDQAPDPGSDLSVAEPVAPPAAQPQPTASPAQDVNPYAQFAPQASSAPATHAAQPMAAQPTHTVDSAPATATSQYDASTMEASNGFHEVSPERAAAAEAHRQRLAMLINGGKGRAEIDAYLKTQGIDPASVKGLDAAIAQVARHPGTVVPVGFSDSAVRAADPKEYHGEDKGALDAFGNGIGNFLTFNAKDEIRGGVSAGLNSLGNLVGLGSGESFSDRYTRERDDERQTQRDAEYYHPGAEMAGEITGAVPLAFVGGTEVAGAKTAVQALPRLAAEGAAYGGVSGFNGSDGDLKDRLIAGTEGAATGAVLSGALGTVSNKIAAKIAANRAAPNAGQEVLDAASRLNAGAAAGEEIQPLIAHTSNGGLGSTLSAVAEPMIVPGRLSGLDRATGRFETNSGLARDRIANDLAGGVSDDLNTVAARQANPANAGTLASYDAESKLASNALYDNAAKLAGDARLSTPNTVAAIDRKLAEWREVPGGVAGQQALADLRDILDSGAWTVDGLRRLRTSFGDSIDSSNRTVKEAAKALWPELSRDINEGLRTAGKSEAARAYRAADANYATRSQNLDSINLILGDGQHSADTVAANISRMSRSDYDQLSRAIGTLAPAEQNSIRGAIVDNLGRASPGKQDASGERFSLESFLTQWSGKNFSDQAKAAILPAATVRDMNDLATLAGSNRLYRAKGNPSRSGVTIANIGEISAGSTAATAAIATGSVAGGLSTVAAALALYGSGKLLASPGVASGLVRLAKGQPMKVVAQRLTEAARRSPLMSRDILGFRDVLVGGKLPPNAVTVSEPAQTDPVDAPGPIEPDNPYAQYAHSPG